MYAYQNKENNSYHLSQFYVVHFLKEPFKGVDNYVCVPYTWVLGVHSVVKSLVVVTYPKKKNPLITKERAKKQEIFKDGLGWVTCTAELKYQSDIFEDAELWILNKSLVPENSKTNGTCRTLPWDHDLRSFNHKYFSNSKSKSKKKLKPNGISKKQLQKYIGKDSLIEAKIRLLLKREIWRTTVSAATNDAKSIEGSAHSSKRNNREHNKKESSFPLIEVGACTNISNQFHQPLESQNQVQRAANQRDDQQSQFPANIPILQRKNILSPILQGVDKIIPPPASQAPNSIHQAPSIALDKYPMNEQKSQAIVIEIPKEQKEPGLINVFKNGTILNQLFPYISGPTRSRSQSPSVALPSAHKMNQKPCLQTQKVYQSDRTNLKTKQVCFQDNVSSVTKQSKVVSSGYPTNLCTQKPLSPNYVEAADSGMDTNNEATSSYKMTVNEALDAASEIDRTEHNSVERSTAPNLQAELVLQQQIVEQFCTVSTQVNSYLQNAINMIYNLQNSFLETAKSYQTSYDNKRADTPSSSNIIQEVPGIKGPGERQNSVSGRRNSISIQNKTPYKNHQSNDVSETPEKIQQKDSRGRSYPTRRFVLPAEYNPNDTKWTLKYQGHEPGLVELMIGSNIYVSNSGLKRCEQISNSYQSLARLLLHEVFNEKALGVCASMNEITKRHYKSSPSARTPLDNYGSLVLLNYVILHGVKANWCDMSLPNILKDLDDEFKEMRFQYGINSAIMMTSKK